MSFFSKLIAAPLSPKRSSTQYPSPPSSPQRNSKASASSDTRTPPHSPERRLPSSPLRQAFSASTLESPTRTAVNAALEQRTLEPAGSPLIGELVQRLREDSVSLSWIDLAGMKIDAQTQQLIVSDLSQFELFFRELRSLKETMPFHFTDNLMIPLLQTLMAKEISLADPYRDDIKRGGFHFLPEAFVKHWNSLSPISIGYRFQKSEPDEEGRIFQERTSIEVRSDQRNEAWAMSHTNPKGKKTKTLGEGGWGYVRFVDSFQATQTPHVAKKIPVHMGGFYDTLYYVVREMIGAQTLMGVPNAVGFERCVLSFGSNGNPKIYGFMPYVPGETLLKARMSRETLRQGMASLADTVAAAHTRHLLLCDLKPENVLVEKKSNRFVLVDFGMSSLLEDHEGRSVSKGTSEYWAPEINPATPLTRCFTPASDVYAFALVYLEKCTGFQLFTSPRRIHPQDDYQQAMRCLDWALQNKHISPEERVLLGTMLAIKPEDRPTMNSVAAQLSALVHPTISVA